jgi:hypothetical protein
MANTCSPRTELVHLRMDSIFAKPTLRRSESPFCAERSTLAIAGRR